MEDTTAVSSSLSSLGSIGALWGFFAAYLAISLIVGLAVYIYMAWALMVIAQKTQTPNAWLAWIPIGNLYLMTQIAQVPWWTMLVIVLAWVPFIGYLAVIAVTLWWWWKIAERRGKPGWYAILLLVPIANIIIPGVIAWSD